MALEIGGGITLGGGISLTVESGGGGGASTFTVGDGKTVLISTSTGASERIVITTIGQQAALASWTTTATLTRTGGSGTVAYDSEMAPPMDNGDGTWTYSFYVSPTNYPGDYTWDSMELVAGGGGGGGTTYTNTSTTFLGNGDAPPWVVSSLYNSGTLFKITTASSPSSEFLAAINALTTGSQLTIVDTSEGTVSITLTSGFSGTYTTGNEEYSASCTSTGSFSTGITSITIL